MRVQLSDEVQREIEQAIRAKASESLVVDVYATAQEIQRRHAAGETDLAAIVASITHLAAQCGCAVELGTPPRGCSQSA